MTDATFVFGQRSDGLRGVFIAPPGVDADSAPIDELVLYYGALSTQIIAKGYVTTFPAVVPLGLTAYIPRLFVHRIQAISYGGGVLQPGFCKPDSHFWSEATIEAITTPTSFSVDWAGGDMFWYAINGAAP